MTIEKNQYGNYRVVIDYAEDNAVVIELSQAQMEQIQQHMNHQDMMENVRQALSGSSDCGRNVVDDTDYVDYIASCAESIYAESDNEALSDAIASAAEETPYQDFCAEEDDNE